MFSIKNLIFRCIITFVSCIIGTIQVCNAAEEEWPNTTGTLHVIADTLTLASIVTGGVAAIAGINDDGNIEFPTSVTSMACIIAGGLTRGLADYFEAKASPDICTHKQCSNCCNCGYWFCETTPGGDCRRFVKTYIPNFSGYANKYKKASEFFKLATYGCYAVSTGFGIASAASEKVEPFLDIVSLVFASAAIVCNKNIFRYGYIYSQQEATYRDKILQLGDDILSYGPNRDDPRRLAERQILMNTTYYLQWATSMREISQRFSVSVPLLADTRGQLDNYEQAIGRPAFTNTLDEQDLYHAQLVRELSNIYNHPVTGVSLPHTPGEPLLVDQATYVGFAVLQ